MPEPAVDDEAPKVDSHPQPHGTVTRQHHRPPACVDGRRQKTPPCEQALNDDDDGWLQNERCILIGFCDKSNVFNNRRKN